MKTYTTQEDKEKLTQKLRKSFRALEMSQDHLKESLEQSIEISRFKGNMDYNPTPEEYRSTCIERDRKNTYNTIEKFVDEISNADNKSSDEDYSNSLSCLNNALAHLYENVGGPYGNILTTRINSRVAKRALAIVERRVRTLNSTEKKIDWYSNPESGGEADWLYEVIHLAKKH